jgi:hypothetical protein
VARLELLAAAARAQGNLSTSEVIRIGDPVAPGVLAAGLLPREVIGVRGAVAQRVHAGRHAVGIGRVHRGGDEAQRIGDAGLVSGVVIGVARAVTQGVHRGGHLTGKVIDGGGPANVVFEFALET